MQYCTIMSHQPVKYLYFYWWLCYLCICKFMNKDFSFLKQHPRQGVALESILCPMFQRLLNLGLFASKSDVIIQILAYFFLFLIIHILIQIF